MIAVLVSGGKDSTATLLLAIERHGKENVFGIFTDTGWEAKCTYAYLDYLEKKTGVAILRLRNKKWGGLLDLIEKKKRFPSTLFRFCTSQLKIVPIAEFLANTDLPVKELWFGIRKQESQRRAKKYKDLSPEETYLYADWLDTNSGDVKKAIKQKIREKGILLRFPLLEWSEEDVFEYLKKKDVSPNPLYFKGHKRVGCYPCILGSLQDYKLCWKDKEGRQNILKLMELEKKLNERGFNTRLKDNITAKELVKRLEFEDDQIPLFGSPCSICSI